MARVILKGGAADDVVAVVAADPRVALLGDDDGARQQLNPMDGVGHTLAVLQGTVRRGVCVLGHNLAVLQGIVRRCVHACVL